VADFWLKDKSHETIDIIMSAIFICNSNLMGCSLESSSVWVLA
jgi:hypothetical protein